VLQQQDRRACARCTFEKTPFVVAVKRAHVVGIQPGRQLAATRQFPGPHLTAQMLGNCNTCDHRSQAGSWFTATAGSTGVSGGCQQLFDNCYRLSTVQLDYCLSRSADIIRAEMLQQQHTEHHQHQSTHRTDRTPDPVASNSRILFYGISRKQNKSAFLIPALSSLIFPISVRELPSYGIQRLCRSCVLSSSFNLCGIGRMGWHVRSPTC
jgi:hypothetical protein